MGCAFNPHLLRAFDCHINVEACSSIKSVKYLFKYVYKGHDRASIAVRESGQADKENAILWFDHLSLKLVMINFN